jgi:hypothetical protein
MNMTNLKPDVDFGQRLGRIGQNILEAIERQIVLELLLVDDPQSKVNFIGLVEIRVHIHDLRKRFLGILQGSISIVQDAYPVPQFRVLGVS